MQGTTRLIISVLVGAALAALIAFQQTPPAAITQVATPAGGKIGGSFAGLVDETGKTVDAAAFSGLYKLVFFGFTHCPSVCPTELQKMTSVLKKLDAGTRARLAPLFVSVDPERDTPSVMADYTAMFHADIKGLTGTPEAIRKVMADWKVYAAKVPDERTGAYSVDHSAFLYFTAPDGSLLGLFGASDGPDKVLAGITAGLGMDKTKPGTGK